MSKNKQVSNLMYLLLVVLAAMVLIMANNMVSCENVNGDHHVIGSNHHRHHQHNDGSNTKEIGHNGHLAYHPHLRHIGNRKVEVGHGEDGHVVPNLGCTGAICSFTGEAACADGCSCLPIFGLLGVCSGSCCG